MVKFHVLVGYPTCHNWCCGSLFDYLLAYKDFRWPSCNLFHWISSTITAARFSSVDTELVAYLAGCKSYNKNNGLNFWVSQEPRFPLLAPLAQYLLCAPASQAYVERVFSVWGFDKWEEEPADKEVNEPGIS